MAKRDVAVHERVPAVLAEPETSRPGHGEEPSQSQRVMLSSAGRRAPSAPRARGDRTPEPIDPITALAMQRLRESHPHERLLTIAGCTMAEFAKRLSPPVSRKRLVDVFAAAEAYGRMSQVWADRLAAALDVEAAAVLALFGVTQPSRPGRPRGRNIA
jgi:hypothetical protein